MVPGERHGDHPLEGVGEHGSAPLMCQAIGAASDKYESNDVENAKTSPERQGREDVLLVGY